MAQGSKTRRRLLDAAYRILSEESLSDLNITRITEVAGVSKRTFFTHFTGKDELLAALVAHMRPLELDRYRAWGEAAGPSAENRIRAVFEQISELAQKPEWKGSGFIRISAELGDLTGHPVHGMVAAANRDLEGWFAHELRAAGYEDADSIARQLVVLVNGLFIIQFVHRNDIYAREVIRHLPALLATGKSATGAPSRGTRKKHPRS